MKKHRWYRLRTAAILLMVAAVPLVSMRYHASIDAMLLQMASDGPKDLAVAAQSDRGTPVKLRIPALDVDAPISRVGLTKDGAMDIPKSAFEIGWYEEGARPGEKGSAVLAGHRDTVLSTPGVFWDLHNLKEGDEILIDTDRGYTIRFVVKRSQEYPYNAAPMEEIFGPSNERRLNLITCSGQWDNITYSDRLVVFTEEQQPIVNAKNK